MPHLKLSCDQMISIMTPSSPSSVDRVLRHFAERTTMHGVPRIINAHSLPARIFWAFICLGAFVMFFWQTAILMERYFCYPKKVNMEIIQKPVPFPSVTVCNTDHLDFEIVHIIEKLISIEEVADESIYKNKSSLEKFGKAYTKFYDNAVSFLTVDLMANGDKVMRDQAMLRDTLEVNSRIGMTANLGKDMASEAGVKLQDFIMSCQFMTNECPINTSFTKVFDPYYYNCFTFEPETMVASRKTRLQGVEYGLSLLLYSGSAGQFLPSGADDNPMYIIPGFMEPNSALSSGRGARVVIHSPGTRPHPTYDGFDIAPGFSVTIGVKGRENVRINAPHGNCTAENPEHKESSKFNYTLIECQNKCIQDKIKKRCACLDSRLPDLPDMNDNKSRTDYCLKLPQVELCMHNLCNKEVNNWKARFKCRKDMYENITIKELGALDDCKCYPPCQDMIYDTSYSLSKLPDLNSKEASAYSVALDKFFMKNFPDDKKDLLKQKHGENFTDIVHQHVSRLNVHIADSNIIKTTEQPDYEAIRLISDIGGQLGLWIGISVITLFEVLQLIVDLFHFITSKGRSAHERKLKANGRAVTKNLPQPNNFNEQNNDYTSLRYWDHRYSFKDCKPESRYECDKLTTV